MTATGPAKQTSMENRIARVFGLHGATWTRHANPWSVATRFLVLPLLALSVWSRDWIGWWCLVPVALSLVFMMVNPLLFPPPRSTRNWASKAVFGERVYAERATVPIPEQFRGQLPNVANALAGVGLALLAWALWVLSPLAAVAALVLTQTAKAWYLDRMVLLYDDVKKTVPTYASWEY